MFIGLAILDCCDDLLIWRLGNCCGGNVQYAYDRHTRVGLGELLSRIIIFSP